MLILNAHVTNFVYICLYDHYNAVQCCHTVDKTGKHFCWFEPSTFDLFPMLIVSLSLFFSLSHFMKSLKLLFCIYLSSIIVVRGRKINQTCPPFAQLLENHFQYVIIYININTQLSFFVYLTFGIDRMNVDIF